MEEDLSDNAEENQKLINTALEIVKSHAHEEDWTEDERNVLVSVIEETKFFQRNLDPSINFDDFKNEISRIIHYEEYKKGERLIEDGAYADKFCLILQGSVRKYATKQIEELDHEIHQRIKALRRNSTFKKAESKFLESTDSFSSQIQDTSSEYSQWHSSFGSKKARKYYSMPKHKKKDTKNSPSPSIYNSSNGLRNRRPRSRVKINIIRAQGEYPKPPGVYENIPQHKPGIILKTSKKSKKNSSDVSHKDSYAKALEIAEDEQLFSYMAGNNDELRSTYFLEGVMRLKRVGTFEPGHYFGETFLKDRRPKNLLTIAAEDLHLLAIYRKDYYKALNNLAESVIRKNAFFVNLIPEASEDSLKSFATLFKEKGYKKNEVIFSEGDIADAFYILRDGEVELSKMFEEPDHLKKAMPLFRHTIKKEALCIAKIGEGQIFGDENFLRIPKRLYRATAGNHGAFCYIMKHSTFRSFGIRYREIMDSLKNQVITKHAWRKERAKNVINQAISLRQSPANRDDFFSIEEVAKEINILKKHKSISHKDEVMDAFIKKLEKPPKNYFFRPKKKGPIDYTKKDPKIVRHNIPTSHLIEFNQHLNSFSSDLKETTEKIVSPSNHPSKLFQVQFETSFDIIHKRKELSNFSEILSKINSPEPSILPPIHSRNPSFVPSSKDILVSNDNSYETTIPNFLLTDESDSGNENKDPIQLSKAKNYSSPLLNFFSPKTNIKNFRKTFFKNDDGSYTFVNGKSRLRQFLSYMENSDMEPESFLKSKSSVLNKSLIPLKTNIERKSLIPRISPQNSILRVEKTYKSKIV